MGEVGGKSGKPHLPTNMLVSALAVLSAMAPDTPLAKALGTALGTAKVPRRFVVMEPSLAPLLRRSRRQSNQP